MKSLPLGRGIVVPNIRLGKHSLGADVWPSAGNEARQEAAVLGDSGQAQARRDEETEEGNASSFSYFSAHVPFLGKRARMTPSVLSFSARLA